MGSALGPRNWVFLYTPKEVWEEVERLADAANQNYHEGLGGGKSSGQNTQNGGAKRSNKKVNDTRKVSSMQCGVCLLARVYEPSEDATSTENDRWSALQSQDD